MDEKELHEIIAAHARWLNNEGGKRADLSGANLRGADLHEADLHEADLHEADLHEANLVEADLHEANLIDADLSGANLRGADLRDADLRSADLCGADLRGADICGADICGADICGADLTEKIVQVGPIGSRNSYTVYFVDRDIVQCGCWKECKGGSLEQFEARVDKVYPADDSLHPEYRREYLAAIALFKALKEG